MPVVFVGHGSPMNAIEENAWSAGWRELAASLPRPRVILCVSAHWVTPGTFVTAQPEPPTIHDFGGFPPALSRVQYPAPGAPAAAARVAEVVGGRVNADWGFDHGSWSVTKHMWRDADVPMIQLSLDGHLPATEHVALARSLQPLRDEGFLILGSGNATHNLRDAFRHLGDDRAPTPAWAARFDDVVAKAFETVDPEGLARAGATDDGRMAHPTPDHFWPMLYPLAVAERGEPVRFPVTGFAAGSLSMRAAVIG